MSLRAPKIGLRKQGNWGVLRSSNGCTAFVVFVELFNSDPMCFSVVYTTESLREKNSGHHALKGNSMSRVLLVP